MSQQNGQTSSTSDTYSDETQRRFSDKRTKEYKRF